MESQRRPEQTDKPRAGNYVAPAVRVLGTVEEVTRGTKTNGNDGGVGFKNSRS